MTLLNLGRALVTIAWFALFAAIWISAWRPRRGDEYAASAQLPLEDCERVSQLPEENA